MNAVAEKPTRKYLVIFSQAKNAEPYRAAQNSYDTNLPAAPAPAGLRGRRRAVVRLLRNVRRHPQLGLGSRRAGFVSILGD